MVSSKDNADFHNSAKKDTALADKIRAIAQPRKTKNGKIILDRNDPSDKEWFEDNKIGEIFKK